MEIVPLGPSDIQRRIFTLRNRQVMLDRDLARLYGVKTMVLNQAVKRNINRFPPDFRFQLNQDELSEVITICDSPQEFKYLPVKPYAFTEQGVAMLSAVLKSERAVQVSIQIMQTFVQVRHLLQTNGDLFSEIEQMKIHQVKIDGRIDELFTLMDQCKVDDTQGVFFRGQIFDAYAKFESFIRQAQKSLVLIDNYVDLSVLERLAAKRRLVQVTIWTSPKTKLTNTDISAFNAQYPNLEVRFTEQTHDRFLIVDGSTLYHIGASLKDLGKKCFAFEILDVKFIPVISANLLPGEI